MAGDWIKVEVATLDKPEVIRMAELLGVKRDEMIGILFRFWAWLDRSSGNGVVTHTSRFGIDEVMHCVGFAAALEAVKWAAFDDAAVTLTVPNFAKHNGNPAKTRALGKDRKREFEERKRNAECVTREEKRRDISTSLRSVDSAQRATRLSKDWQPTPEDLAFAKRERPNWPAAYLQSVVGSFRDYWVAKPKNASKLDWAATWRTWIRKQHDPPTERREDARARVAREMYGDALQEIRRGPTEYVIEGNAVREVD